MKKLLAMLMAVVMILALTGFRAGPKASVSDLELAAGSVKDAAEKADADWPEVTITLGHCMSDDSIINDYALYLQDAADKATNGTVKIEIYPSSVLGTEVAMFESMTANSLDMMITTPSVIMNFVGDIGIFDIPYLIQDYDHARAVWESQVGQDIEAQLEDLGIECYGVLDFGYRQTTNNVRPIETPDDVKGLKMRTMSSEVSLALWEELGAEPIAMAINEVFSALQTNVIDGQENPYTAIQTNGFYEVQKYCSATQHQYNMLNMIITEDALSRMADDQKEAFLSIFEGLEEQTVSMMDARTQKSVEFMEENGMQFNECDLDAFREAAQPVIERFSDVYGQENIELIQSLAE